MKVLVPLNNLEHFTDYVDAGAGEFYMGFYDDAWYQKFGEYGDINRLTGFKKEANPHNLKEVMDIIRTHPQAQIYITFNASLYSDEQLAYLSDYMEQLKEVNVSGVIVSCIELVHLAKKIGLYTVISTIAGIYNEDIARFYQAEGADRIILPRDMSAEEIVTVTKKVPGVDYEVFMMRNGCAFSDSNCLGMHRLELKSMCSCLSNAEKTIYLSKKHEDYRKMIDRNSELYEHEFHNLACGLCSIYQFVQAGITAGKIVGRSDQWENVCNDIRLIHDNVEIAQICNSEQEYFDRMIYPEERENYCHDGLSCYYPELRY